MVSGNVPDFNALSKAEQRVVAERLQKIEQSAWQPFWCPRADCDGMPHKVLGPLGQLILVDENLVSGPNGEVVGGRVWQTPGGDWVFEDDGEIGVSGDTCLGRVLHDPAWAHNHARVDQRLPPWNTKWTLMMLSGRGSGKTTIGVEFVTLCARKGLDGMIVGRRGTELENTHVATLIARAHPEFVPTYLASKDILVWPEVTLADGSKKKPITYLFSAERPENIRSVNTSYAWFDEASWMDEITKAWANAKFATRVKDPDNPIHFLITSTPTPTEWTMKMEDDPNVEVRRVSTYANKANLSQDFIEDLRAEYEGTRLGRQEIHGEVLRDVVGALWNDDMFVHHNAPTPSDYENLIDSMDDRVLAVDPAGSKGPRSDAHGIVGVGVQHFDENEVRMPASQFFVLGDYTLKGTPHDRSAQVFKAARAMRVNRIVVEKNYGGEDVKQGLADYAKLHPEEACDEDGDEYKIELVHAAKSKESRAEPTVGKYEQGRVTHVTSPGTFGDMSALEKEQTTWVPKSRGGKSPSPNRIDALVWAVRALETKVRYSATMASQRKVSSVITAQPVVAAQPVVENAAPVSRFPVKKPRMIKR